MTKAYLKPIYSGQKSFNNKAVIVIDGETKTLISYITEVIRVEAGQWQPLAPLDKYTATTMKHVKEFLLQTTGQEITKADIKRRIK